MAGQLEPEYTPQRKERFVCIIHCVIIAVQVLLLVCYSHYQPLMLIYHQEYQSLEGILMGHFLREWFIQMLVIKMIVINIQKV
ncbi:hypothetical protein AIC17_15870 [Salmonella enterica subsp. enterica serovar Enteritidis]|nr:hypothetical protein [Salmonella enterica subsp. enterica serovar Enteritidis]EDL1592404.1 hypothetical protein [Salmonella enterica subsp. enterica serovar Enteritidis]EDL2873184.1 hypothetical protein [Salmonella enterica subsp. enterica serovar Enteritidis]EDM2953187.1 hypothetical protein [Salmonella enterica subsp. enterica serovar Enteritidis]EGW3302203.1 hypothetical protein [Salmonella enterica subsp. enterica serovar Enteritidis]